MISIWILRILFLTSVADLLTSADLIVNVRNQGGEIYKEEITSNVLEETISLSFESPGDGSFTHLFIDFKNDIQVIQTDVLGEEDQPNDPMFMSYCFVTKFVKDDFIPPDAMAKLRQKNPWSIRIPERVLSADSANATFLDVVLDTTWTDWISPHLKTLCSSSVTMASKLDLLGYLEQNNSENYLRAVRPLMGSNLECGKNRNSNGPCVCTHPICVGWFPCALKYCSRGSQIDKSYRCGIHTCKQCKVFNFSVSSRHNCLSN